MYNWIIGIPLLTLFAAVGLAIVVIPSTRQEHSRPFLIVLLVLVALLAFCSVMFHSISFPSTKFWLYLIIAFGTCTSAVGVHFSAHFTHRTGWIAKGIVSIFYIVSSVALVLLFTGQIVEGAELLPNGAVEIDFTPMTLFFWSAIACMILTALVFLITALVSSSSGMKRYTIFPLIGFMVMCIGSLSNIIFNPYPVDIAAYFIFISFLTYGVTRGHLLRQSSWQPWRLSLPTIGFMLALCYLSVVVFCLKWLGITLGTSYLIAAIIVITLGSTTFGPSRKFFSGKFARYFFSNTYLHKQALADLACIDSSVARWENNVTNILNIIARVTRVDSAVLLLRNSNTKYFEGKYAVGRNPAVMLQIRFPLESPLAKFLIENGAPVDNVEIKRQLTSKILLRGEDDTLREIGPTLCCGIQGYGTLLAIVALTRKSPQAWDATEDRDFLRLACSQITPIIINADLYRESQLEIEERKRVEKELKISREQLRNLSLHLQMAREEERTNIAREIHDELGQALTALKMDLSWVSKQLLTDKGPPLVKVSSMLKLIDTTIKKLRRIVSELRPAILDDLGLVAAIEWQVNEFQSHTGIKCLFSMKREDIEMDKQRAITIFRTLQEALTNVARHAHATKVVVKLEKAKGKLVLTVKDNGRGIKKDEISHSQSFGLIGMRERAHAFGGEVGISGIRGKGTILMVNIPLERNAEINDKSIDC